MRELDVNGLRALIRIIPPLRSLREDVEKSLHLELYDSAGDLAVRSLEALRDEILDITQDRYVAALSLDVAQSGGDREKFTQVLLVSGQLLAFLEAHTGVSAALSGREQYQVQTAPNISLNMGDVVSGGADKIMDFIDSAVTGAMRGAKVPKPPKPPKPPKGSPFDEHDFPGMKPKRGRGFFYEHDDDDDEV